MFKELVSIIKQTIKDYEEAYQDIIRRNNSSVKKYSKEIALLKDDYNNIIDIDMNIFNEILNETEYNSEEKSSLLGIINSIKRLLALNKEKNTTFVLTESQYQYLSKFVRIITDLERKSFLNEINSEDKLSEINDKLKRLSHLLGILEDEKNKDFINDTQLIMELIEKYEKDHNKRKKLLINILNYNKEQYKSKVTDEITLEDNRLNIEEVRNVFKSYNYNFDDLAEQEDILNYGNTQNIYEVLRCLFELRYPRLDLKRQGKKLVALCINSNKELIKKITDYSRPHGIFPRNLLMLIPALLEQKTPRADDQNKKVSPSIITGRSSDYIANVDFLSNLGFDIAYVYNKCKEILVLNPEKLKNNYKKYTSYGFTFDKNQSGDLTHPALCFLISNNFEEIVDQFIEISTSGYNYIKNNMSRVSAISDAYSIVFYNIYASYLKENHLGIPLDGRGPFINYNSSKLKLRGEITRFSAEYQNVPYQGITEENKREYTMTIIPEINNKEEFDEAVRKSKEEQDYDDDMYTSPLDEQLEKLEKYIDEDNPLRYNFDGILISKMKVIRIYSILKKYNLDDLEDSLLYAITYNTIINQNNFDQLKHIVKEKNK